ncbi:hypothetical protein FB451DRAFT_1182697 [Mycena latifolia]|nr:hypothetical protein FB451DRAFT_1182697 [Mycena latifolia]
MHARRYSVNGNKTSAPRRPGVYLSVILSVIHYATEEKNSVVKIPFPDHARGFILTLMLLHWMAAYDSASPLIGRHRRSLGPRLDASEFPQDAACHGIYAGIGDQLVHERLVTQEQLSRCRDVFGDNGQIFPHWTVFRLDSTFLLLSVDWIRYSPLRALNAPEHTNHRVLHMRIVKILKPVACNVDLRAHRMRMMQPEEGQLLTVRDNRSGITGPWVYGIDDPKSTGAVAFRVWDTAPKP